MTVQFLFNKLITINIKGKIGIFSTKSLDIHDYWDIIRFIRFYRLFRFYSN